MTNIFCYTNNSVINRPLMLCNDTVAPEAVYCVQDRGFSSIFTVSLWILLSSSLQEKKDTKFLELEWSDIKPQQQGNSELIPFQLSSTVVSRYNSTYDALSADSWHAVPCYNSREYRTNFLSLLLCVCHSFNIWMFSSHCRNTKQLILYLGSTA